MFCRYYYMVAASKENEQLLEQLVRELRDQIEELETDKEMRACANERMEENTKILAKLSPSQPIFYGNEDEDIEKWLFVTDINLENAGVNDTNKVKAIITYLRDNALQVIKQVVKKNVNISWELVKQTLRSTFRRKNLKMEFIIKNTIILVALNSGDRWTLYY